MIVVIFLAVILLLWQAGKGRSEAPIVTDKVKVAATIFPLYDIVKEIGGDKVDTILILPPGASPHTYDVSPAQVKEVQGVRYFFAIGAGIDAWVMDISAAAQGRAEVVNLNEYISLQPFKNQVSILSGNAEEDEEAATEHAGLDPHYWLSPENGRIMARQIAARLSAADPDNASYYEERYRSFSGKLDIAEAGWQEQLGGLEKRSIVVLHDAWGYFSRYFGLEVAASFEPFPGQSPSPRYLAAVQEQIKNNNIPALFVEPQLSKEALATLAADLGVKVETLDPLGGFAGRESYIELIGYNVESIYEALK